MVLACVDCFAFVLRLLHRILQLSCVFGLLIACGFSCFSFRVLQCYLVLFAVFGACCNWFVAVCV